MSEKIITVKDVEYVAKLARIALTELEKAKYQNQIENILQYVAQLKGKITEGIHPTSHPHDIVNVMRVDRAKPFDNIPAILGNAPEREENFYKVKKVIE